MLLQYESILDYMHVSHRGFFIRTNKATRVLLAPHNLALRQWKVHVLYVGSHVVDMGPILS